MKIPKYFIPKTPEEKPIDPSKESAQIARIQKLLKEKNAVVIAHYYTPAAVQKLADASGGCVADSLVMAQFGMKNPAKTLVVAGVRFMGETAKILSPEKHVIMPTLKAECSLDLSCPADAFTKFCDEHPDRTVVVYANTSAAVKARADWVVTSSNAPQIIDHLASLGKKILWASDRYLGSYLQKKTGADMLLWQGSCVVHEEFKAKGVKDLMQEYHDAAVLVHPESPAEVIALATAVGSTSQLLKAVSTLKNKVFIVATDKGIFYKMQQAAPDKKFIAAPTAGEGATCRSCAHCPWMAMNELDLLEESLVKNTNEIILDPEIIRKAAVPLMRMIHF